MRVLAIDGALRNSGWCVMDEKPFAVGQILTNPKMSEAESLFHIYHETLSLIETHRPDRVVLEDQFMGRNVKTLKRLSAARGAILVACGQGGVPVTIIEPTRIKQLVSGKGHAGKLTVEEAVRPLVSDEMTRMIETFKKQDDVWDAIAIAVAGSI